MPYDLCDDIPSLDVIETEMTRRGKQHTCTCLLSHHIFELSVFTAAPLSLAFLIQWHLNVVEIYAST